jgi:hypothetical protein
VKAPYEHGAGTRPDRTGPNICPSNVCVFFCVCVTVWGVAAFLGSALGPMIGGPLLYLIGHNEHPPGNEDDPDYTIQGYAVLLGLSSFYFFVSAVALRWVKNAHV